MQESGSPTIVIRPLLENTRSEIFDYLSRKKQAYRIDVTNQDLSFDRNWIRHQLIPTLEQQLNPQLFRTVGRTTRLFREIETFLQQQGQQQLERCRQESEGEIILRISVLKSLPQIMQKEVVRLALRESKGDLRGITLQHIEDILALNEGASGKEVHLPGNLKVQREFECLCLTQKQGVPKFSYELSIPGEIYVKEIGKRVVARKIQLARRKENRVLLQLSGDRLQVRNRRPSDHYHTTATTSGTKLKELFQAKRIPKSRRERLVILEANGAIVWVEGFSPPPQFRVSSGLKEVVEIEVRAETLESKNSH